MGRRNNRSTKKQAPKRPIRIVVLDFSEANFAAWEQFHRDKEAVTQFLTSE